MTEACLLASPDVHRWIIPVRRSSPIVSFFSSLQDFISKLEAAACRGAEGVRCWAWLAQGAEIADLHWCRGFRAGGSPAGLGVGADVRGAQGLRPISAGRLAGAAGTSPEHRVLDDANARRLSLAGDGRWRSPIRRRPFHRLRSDEHSGDSRRRRSHPSSRTTPACCGWRPTTAGSSAMPMDGSHVSRPRMAWSTITRGRSCGVVRATCGSAAVAGLSRLRRRPLHHGNHRTRAFLTRS